MVFTFKLQKILDLKLRQEDEKKNQIASLMKSIRTKEEEIKLIYEDKKQWFWPHKRFKSHYKEIYEKSFNNK